MVILARCNKCHAQYDVSSHKAGDVLRCRCGGLITVAQPRVGDARLIRCPSCGGVRGAGGDTCEYCGARFSAADKGWGLVCPSCFCRLPLDAQYCVECGLKLDPQKLERLVSPWLCPRCQRELHARELDRCQVYECPSCAGLWLPTSTFDEICRDREEMGRAAYALGAGRGTHLPFEPTAEEQIRYIPCPVCKNLMNRHNYADISGVIINVCGTCGVWLDNQELNHIIQFIQSGGLERAVQRREQDRQHAARMRENAAAQHMYTDAVRLTPRDHLSDVGETDLMPLFLGLVHEVGRFVGRHLR